MKFQEKFSLPFIITFILVAVDFALRFKDIENFEFIELGIYSISILFFYHLTTYLHSVLIMKHKKSFINYIINAGGVLIFIIGVFMNLIAYSVSIYFGIIPNKEMIQYIMCEPSTTWSLVSSQVASILKIFIIILILLVVVWYSLRYLTKERPHRKLLKFVSLFLSLIVLLTGQRNFDQCYLPTIQLLLFSTTTMYEMYEMKRGGNANNDSLAIMKPLTFTSTHLPTVNIILIINEGIRRSGISLYNDSLMSTPNLLDFKKRHKDHFYQFQRAYTNSTMTYLSVPSILNGLSPTANYQSWKTTLMLWDYAKAAGMYTFFISGHCFNWSNWKEYFFRSKTLDYCYTECDYSGQKEKQKSRQHMMGISDDSIIIDKFINKIESLDQKNYRFFAILHLYGTHFPYWHRLSNRLDKTNSKIAPYVNSIYQQDISMKPLYDYFNQKNLIRNTAVIYTSDHGEAFGERGYNGHLLNYYEEDIGIPLWILLPSTFMSRQNLPIFNNQQKNVCNIDILPTIFDLIGIKYNIPRITQLDGCSLLEPIPNSRQIIVCNRSNLRFKMNTNSYALLTDSIKTIYKYHNLSLNVECYNIFVDPKETHNLHKVNGSNNLLYKWPIHWNLLINNY
jgi:glucan phosphoethanolaminetransferase (alkaline phosphatase superfamily)